MSGKIIPFTSKDKRILMDKQQGIYEHYSEKAKAENEEFLRNLRQLLIDYEDEGDGEIFQKILEELHYAKKKQLGVYVNSCTKADEGIREIEPCVNMEGVWYMAIYTGEDTAGASEFKEAFDEVHKACFGDLVEKLSENEHLAGLCIDPYHAQLCIIHKNFVKKL